MGNNLGPVVSRVLDPTGTGYTEIVVQAGRPPMDAENQLLQEIASGATRRVVLNGTPSGWLLNETATTADYLTNPTWSNWFKFGKQRTGEAQAFLWACVNGWMLPVGGTRTGTPPGSPNDTDTPNVIALDPPPTNAGEARIDFVFLEVWQALLSPNPSATNKPSSSGIWRYGNVEGGFTFLPDDMVDTSLGFETAKRVQLQYRIRVIKGLTGFTTYPDGFDPTQVKAQGAAASPTAFSFVNMRQTLGDPGLWRAGDGTANGLGTVDGYSYAIPIAAVFRRNTVAWAGEPAQNLNGGFNRNPTAIDRTGIKTFSTTPTLSSDLSATATSATLSSATNIPLPANPSTPVYIQIGDEIMTYTAITGTTITGLTRGPAVAGCRAERHASGSTIQVVSGRPDGLYADQIALTDILDLRHAVNPNGYNYDALLQYNVHKLLTGQLRANWKRSGGGPQGPVVGYQDKVAGAVAALGITKVDGPDNIRQIFSDAAVNQRVYAWVEPTASAPPTAIGAAWSLSLTVTQTVQGTPSQFSSGDVFVVPVAQLKSGLPGGDADQVRWINDGLADAVQLTITGQNAPLPTVDGFGNIVYTVTPASPTSADDLTITLGPGFPNTTQGVVITLHVQYGPGRGVARRPDMVHSVEYLSPSSELLLQQPKSAPSSTLPVRTGLWMTWSKFADRALGTLLPTTTESYMDAGSKTLILNPLRRLDMPDNFYTQDGEAANLAASNYATSLGPNGSTVGTNIFTDLTVNFTVLGAVAGDAIVLGPEGVQPGRYTIRSVPSSTSLELDRPIPNSTGPIYTWKLYKAQGLMPLLKRDGVTAKWTTTDPLDLFSGTTDPNATTKNFYVSLPRHLVPFWGAYRIPMLWQDQGLFAEGVNYAFLTGKGAGPYATTTTNYVPYSNGALTYAVFSTVQLQDPTPLLNAATYNTKYTVPVTYAGVRKFTDTSGLNRKGLELPPFYGLARLWAVYEANDYKTNGSGYNATTRAATGSPTAAKNLLRQNFDGPVFWVTEDNDGDSTFVLNADALDLTQSTNFPISSFDGATTHFVIEASIFGFDRGAFTGPECRLVLTRLGSAGYMRSEATSLIDRATNTNVQIAGPVCVLPGPPTGSDQVLVNYSRTPYGGDPWGTQTTYTDIGYAPGALTSATAAQLRTTTLNQSALTRPNQKVLQVLATTTMVTSAGTGRLMGSKEAVLLLPENVGYEDLTAWPPTNPLATRPKTSPGALSGSSADFLMGTQYLGCTERLPLGAFWRDKDFKGHSVGPGGQWLPVSFIESGAFGHFVSPALSNTTEQRVVLDIEQTMSPTGVGDVVVAVDGETGNYSLLTNYRTARGGSVFVASKPTPGGEYLNLSGYGSAMAPAPRVNLLAVSFMLVRNTVTTAGATEVSAGDELMLLVVTTGFKMSTTPAVPVVCHTNGTWEGFSAADLYRIEGHPLEKDHVRDELDPSTVQFRPPFLPSALAT